MIAAAHAAFERRGAAVFLFGLAIATVAHALLTSTIGRRRGEDAGPMSPRRRVALRVARAAGIVLAVVGAGLVISSRL